MSSNSNPDPTSSNSKPISAVINPLAARLHSNRRAAAIIIAFAILIIVGGYYFLRTIVVNNGGFTLSGTIEATEVHLGSDVGGIVDRVNVAEGDRVESGDVVAVVHNDYVRAPIDGVVLERVAEPGEAIPAFSTLVTMADLNDLTLTVYAPEDRYGYIILGQTCPIKIDSFPEKTFKGTVTHIADKAEFTPRNVQTTENRKSTVFAIKIKVDSSDGLLKPGMPADVQFQNKH